MPKGKAPRRSSLYSNINKQYDNGKGIMVSDDMRASSPMNLKMRKKLHETVNKKGGFAEFKKYEKRETSRSLGKKGSK